jgi:NitT/TauT family transport system substrate-binding protein
VNKKHEIYMINISVMKFKHKYITVVIFLLFTLYSCNESVNKNSHKQNVLVATLKGPSAISMVGLIESPESIDTSLKFNFVIKDEPNQVKDLMLKGEPDFAILPATMAAILYNKGIDYKLVAIPVWGTLYLFGTEPVTNWKELKGKHIYMMGKGFTPDIVFRILLEKNGLITDKDVMFD